MYLIYGLILQGPGSSGSWSVILLFWSFCLIIMGSTIIHKVFETNSSFHVK